MHEFFGVTARDTSTLKQLLQFTPDVNSYKIVYFQNIYLLYIYYT